MLTIGHGSVIVDAGLREVAVYCIPRAPVIVRFRHAVPFFKSIEITVSLKDGIVHETRIILVNDGLDQVSVKLPVIEVNH